MQAVPISATMSIIVFERHGNTESTITVSFNAQISHWKTVFSNMAE